jgi:2-dehydro-3-deoxyphosphogluconate aldolase/(4S)-4-hydroxy-2-oxoglutarate aldolase
VKGPLDKVKLLPTGGIDLDDLDAYRKAGADGFGIGSPLFVRKLIEDKNDNGLLEHFRKFVTKVK